MAIDIAGVCSISENNQTPQTIAWVFSTVFALYLGIAILVSSLTILSSTHVKKQE